MKITRDELEILRGGLTAIDMETSVPAEKSAIMLILALTEQMLAEKDYLESFK